MIAGRILRQIAARLSLRTPQNDSLDILADVLSRIAFVKGADPASALAAIAERYPSAEDFELEFASLCFALATGVGKTRPWAPSSSISSSPAKPNLLRARAEHDDL